MKGRSRLAVRNELTDYLLELEDISFLESKKMETEYGEWEEYYLLIQQEKVEAPEYFGYLFFKVNQIMKVLRSFGVQDCGIQEFECLRDTYNILIYVIKNGRDKEQGDRDLCLWF